MKKILLVLSLGLLLFTGCNNTLNTPTERVEEFLGKYQSMDSEVLAQLDSVVSADNSMSDEQKKEYRALMEKQYQNLSYKIKDEKITDDTATVDVEIEVYDYATSITESRKYYEEHEDEFKDDAQATIDANDGTDTNNNNTDNNDTNNDNAVEPRNDNTDDNNNNDNNNNNNNNDTNNGNESNEDSKYIDYKIKQLKDVTDKVKYDITFNLIKEDGNWVIQDISDIDRQKLHGLFEE